MHFMTRCWRAISAKQTRVPIDQDRIDNKPFDRVALSDVRRKTEITSTCAGTASWYRTTERSSKKMAEKRHFSLAMNPPVGVTNVFNDLTVIGLVQTKNIVDTSYIEFAVADGRQ